MKRTLVIVFVLISLLAPLGAREKRPHTGRILLAGLVVTPSPESGSGGLPGVTVEIVGSKSVTTTNKDGQFIFTEAPNGEVTVKFSKSGFQTVMRQAKVDRETLMPQSFTVEMLPDGAANAKSGLSGPGTVYIAYSKRVTDQSNPNGDEKLSDLDLKKMVPYADPLDLVSNPENYDNPGDPSKRPTNPTTINPNEVMLYPPTAPQRSTFLTFQEPPYHLAFDAQGKYLYVAVQSGEIKVFDETDAHEKVAGIPVGPQRAVTCLRRSTDGRWILAGVMAVTPEILVIEAMTAKPVARLPLDAQGAVPSSVASGSGNFLLVTLDKPAQPGSLLMVDGQTGQTVAAIQVGDGPIDVEVNADGTRAFVVNSRSGSVSVVDLVSRSVLGQIAVGVAPHDACFTPAQDKLLVSNAGSNTLSVLDPASLKQTAFVRVGKGPAGVAVSPDGKFCYVANHDAGSLSVVDLQSLKLVHLTDSLPFASPLNVVVRP